ncbi:MAG: MgtC/SapB family protein [Gammaproteobacteria bacterium]|nr:MgtC/SapB family protein [Gammaproteobacteria bacterium]
METWIVITERLFLALLAGSMIGMERAVHGRPAGLRTHALVSIAATLLMLLTVYQWDLLQGMPIETIRTDPTRMAQGIMTGIGFLGAGVIMKDKLTIRGLTTAASIWVTSSIGIMIGMGFYDSAFIATVMTVVILSVFRWLESRLPVRRYAKLELKSPQAGPMNEDELDIILDTCKIRHYPASYRQDDDGNLYIYMTIYSNQSRHMRELADKLSSHSQVLAFSVNPTGD